MTLDSIFQARKYIKLDDDHYRKISRYGEMNFSRVDDKKWKFTHNKLGGGEIDFIDEKTFTDSLREIEDNISSTMRDYQRKRREKRLKKVANMAKKIGEKRSETEGTGVAQDAPPALSEEVSEISFAAVPVPPIGESISERAPELTPSQLSELPDELVFEAPGEDELMFEAPEEEELVFAAPAEGVAISLLPEKGTQTYAAKDDLSLKGVTKKVEVASKKAHDKILGKGKKGRVTIPRALKFVKPGSARSYGDIPEHEKKNPKLGRKVEMRSRNAKESWEINRSPENYTTLGVAIGLMLLPAIVASMGLGTKS